MGLFDGVKKFVNRATGGLFEGAGNIDYNGMFAEQSGMYREELARRNKQFAANEVTNANAVSTNLLVGGNRPIGGSGAAGVNFQKLQDDFAMSVSNTSAIDARSGGNLSGLSNDALEQQKRANAQVVAQDNKRIQDELVRSIGSGMGGRV